ncbi:hypothetical protein [Actinoplanes sp. NBRC 101535]|uniref:hypothetical protein n=1 Tax=Actinoplanes sp. NBRC 101535 TaxID=3032196 RepID=UPI0024A30DA6|nr:hypothetical protein [Actinoplanes sp. NBRC 101535]GLY04078.1 hypothetical protein Acsp01_44570 [Actinoplanes sp. NBRC 101535]
MLSRIAHPLPMSVRQPVTAEWSLERTAGLGPRDDDGVTVFAGPGRTVRVEVFAVPAGETAASAVAALSAGLAERCAGRLTENDGDLLRAAFWLTTAHHEFYGYAATATGVLCVTCLYDDEDDLAWARQVWRSATHVGAARIA